MKLKLLTLVLIFNTVFVFSQDEKQNTSSKRIKIDNPTEKLIHILQSSGIDISERFFGRGSGIAFPGFRLTA